MKGGKNKVGDGWCEPPAGWEPRLGDEVAIRTPDFGAGGGGGDAEHVVHVGLVRFAVVGGGHLHFLFFFRGKMLVFWLSLVFFSVVVALLMTRRGKLYA